MSYPNSDILVSPAWLSEHLDDPNIVIVDCPWAADAYTKAHIPGAVCRPGHCYLKSTDSHGNMSIFLQNESEFEKLCGELGIGADSTVVVYDEWGSIFATRLWWMLKFYGHTNAKVLDGGWQGWVDAGYPVSYKKPEVSASSDFKVTAYPELLIELDELKQNYSNDNWQVLDVRSEDEYNGKAAHGNKRVGHVPGAIHLEWNRFLNNSTDSEAVRNFKSAEQIQALLDGSGVDKNKIIATHCQAAVRATFGAFVLELMGYPPAKVYDGSMAEWANLDDTPLE
ncbi:MAG TPA: sulfurtransferase [Thermodesulfobacteriota bacterium]|nr:sulfurtransferase [Thermodesulfobacteriota bacterium]